MNKNFNYLLSLSLCLASSSVWAQSTDSASPKSYAARVDKIFSQFDQPGSPGCAALVIQDGKSIYERGFGLSNIEHAIPISVNKTRFEIGSTAKQFTATALLLLAQDGKLSLDDDVRKFIPKIPDYGTTISLRHLLNHTSGLRDYSVLFNLNGYTTGEITSDADALEIIQRQKNLNFKPGSAFSYTNTGYFLLSQVVKVVSGKTLAEFAKERIFTPLGMQNTQFVDSHDQVIRHKATSYRLGEGNTANVLVFNDETVGGHGIWATLEDLAKWDQNFYTPTVGGNWLLEQLHNTGKLNDGSPTDYASGLLISNYRGLPIVHHSGAVAGFRTELLRFQKQKFSVAVTCNVMNTSAIMLSRKVADIYLEDQLSSQSKAAATPTPTPTPTASGPVSVAELSKYQGIYWNPVKGQTAELAFQEGKLFFKEQGRPYELMSIGEGRFAAIGNNADKSYLLSLKGNEAKLRIDKDGDIRVGDWERVSSLTPAPTVDATLAGSYSSTELNPNMLISYKEGKLSILVERWDEAMPLEPVFVDTYRMGPVILKFERDHKKDVTGFKFYSDRVLGVQFKRKGR